MLAAEVVAMDTVLYHGKTGYANLKSCAVRGEQTF